MAKKVTPSWVYPIFKNPACDDAAAATRLTSEFALAEAKAGDPLYLSIRVLAGEKLSDGERLFISDLLNARAGKRSKARGRAHEQLRIAKQVMDLVRKNGAKQKCAVAQVIEQRARSRRAVYLALKRFRNFVTKRGDSFLPAAALASHEDPTAGD